MKKIKCQCLQGDHMKYVCLMVLLQHDNGGTDHKTSSSQYS